jgi:hypothetical protein
MNISNFRNLYGLLSVALTLIFCAASLAQGRKPAPTPSRYNYTLKFDAESLPDGVKVREMKIGHMTVCYISNTSDVPLVINERFQNDMLVSGTKLVSGKTYGYFPSGVPMEGKTHLKGWQAPFGEIPETPFGLPTEPTKIHEGRKAGLSKELPKPESFTISTKLDGKRHEIKGTIQYHLNDEYDAYYKTKETKEDKP